MYVDQQTLTPHLSPALWGTSASGSEMLLQMSWRGPVQLHSEGVSLKRGSKEWYLQVQGGARSSYRGPGAKE